MQGSDQMVLDDGHGQSMLAALAAGPEVDLLGAVSATRQGWRRSLQSLYRRGC